jgi:uncharacterized glyoxalase superfamily protein PhnB
MAPQFTGLHFWVRDMAAAVAFYRAIGLATDDSTEEELVRFRLPNGVELALGTYELTDRYDPAFVRPAPGSMSNLALQFHLESRAAVDELAGRLGAAGYTVHLRPFDAFWRSRYCEVADADGNIVGFHGADASEGGS